MMLDVTLQPKQWEVFQVTDGVDYDIKLFQGGFGSGKTLLGCLKGLHVLHSNPGSTWLVGADTGKRLRETTCETYQELLTDAGVRYQRNKTDNTIIIPDWDGARVLFKGLDDPMALRSVNGIGGHLEEASLLTEVAYLEFLGRLRQGGGAGKPIEVILTTNPQLGRGWLYDHFSTRAGVSEEEIRGNVVRISRRRVLASTLENPHVSDAFIAALRASYDEELWRILVEGQDGDYRKGLVCHSWNAANIDESVGYDPDRRIYLTCDFNVDPMCWAVAHVGQVDSHREYEFFDEVTLENTNISEAARVFADRYAGHKAGIIITGDASGNNRSDTTDRPNQTRYDVLRDCLSTFGLENVALDVPQANPRVESRIEIWNGAVCNVDGLRRVKVSPSCKQIINVMQNLKYIPGSDQIFEPTPKMIERDNKLKWHRQDMFDAISYLVSKYEPKRSELRKHSIRVSSRRPQPTGRHGR